MSKWRRPPMTAWPSTRNPIRPRALTGRTTRSPTSEPTGLAVRDVTDRGDREMLDAVERGRKIHTGAKVPDPRTSTPQEVSQRPGLGSDIQRAGRHFRSLLDRGARVRGCNGDHSAHDVDPATAVGESGVDRRPCNEATHRIADQDDLGQPNRPVHEQFPQEPCERIPVVRNCVPRVVPDRDRSQTRRGESLGQPRCAVG